MLGPNVISFSYTDGPKVTVYPGQSQLTIRCFQRSSSTTSLLNAHCITSTWHCHAENNLICIERLSNSNILVISMISHYILGYL